MTHPEQVQLFWWLVAAALLLVAVCPVLFQSIIAWFGLIGL